MLLAAPATPAWMNVPEAVDTEPDPRVRDANYDENYRPEFDPDPIMCISHATEAELDAWLQRLGDTDEAIVNVMVDELHDDLDET